MLLSNRKISKENEISKKTEKELIELFERYSVVSKVHNS